MKDSTDILIQVARNLTDTNNIHTMQIYPRYADNIHKIRIYPQNADNVNGKW